MSRMAPIAQAQHGSTFRFSLKYLLLAVLFVATFLAGRTTLQQEMKRLQSEANASWGQAQLLRENLEQERQSHQLSLLLTGSAPQDVSIFVSTPRLDVRTLNFSPDDRILITGGMTSGVKVWDVTSSSLLRTLVGPQWAIRSVSFGSRGMIAAGGDEGLIFVWNTKDAQPVRKLGIGESRVSSLAFSPDGSRLAASLLTLRDGVPSGALIRLWEPVWGKQMLDLPLPDLYCHQLAFSPDGKLLATVGRSKDSKASINLWDLESGSARWKVNLPQWSAVSVAFSADGKRLATGGGVVLTVDRGVNFVGEVKLWDPSSGQLLQTLKGNENGRFDAIAFSPDGKLLVAGAPGPEVGLRVHKVGSTLQAWDVPSGELLWRQNEGSGGVVALDFSSDGQMIVVCDQEAIKFVEPRHGKTISVLHDGQPLSAAQSTQRSIE